MSKTSFDVTADHIGFVASVSLTAGGAGYTQETVSVAVAAPDNAEGRNAVVRATVVSGLDEITIDEGGSSYETPPTVTITAPPAGGVQATATCTVDDGVVDSITITNRGSGYLVAPTIGFTGGGGDDAEATATITGYVSALTLVDKGSGYETNPTVTISDSGDGDDATATATATTPTALSEQTLEFHSDGSVRLARSGAQPIIYSGNNAEVNAILYAIFGGDGGIQPLFGISGLP